MHIPNMESVVKSSGGDRVYEPKLKSLAKVVIGICANLEITCLFADVSYIGIIDGALKPPGSSFSWT